MKFDGLDDLYQVAVLHYAHTWPDSLKEEDAWKDGKRERMFGVLEGIQQAITVVTEGKLSPELHQKYYAKIREDVAAARESIKIYDAESAADEQ